MLVNINISEKNGNRDITIPWLPEQIAYESGGTVRATYDILDKGPVEVPTGSGLRKYSWKSEFPGKHRTDTSMLHGRWKDPSHYHNILEDWRQKGTLLCLQVVGYPINLDVFMYDYKGTPYGGFGDIGYEVSFIEARDIKIETTVIEDTSKRSTGESSGETTGYTVVRGDNLWKIAQNKLGKGSRNTEIYALNKDIIEATAKKHGKQSSNNGWWIYPSTVLTLPPK